MSTTADKVSLKKSLPKPIPSKIQPVVEEQSIYGIASLQAWRCAICGVALEHPLNIDVLCVGKNIITKRVVCASCVR
jgi:hypothetical protein